MSSSLLTLWLSLNLATTSEVCVSSDKGGWKEETFVIAVCVVLLVIWLWGVYTIGGSR